jgi:hypothetical protein
MAYEKMQKVVQMLSAKTAEGQVAWEQTDEEGVFQVAFPNYAARVLRRVTGQFSDSDEYYVLRIYNQNGSLIEEVVDQDLKDSFLTPPDAYKIMKALYDGARRKAMGIEQALDQILATLETDTPF